MVKHIVCYKFANPDEETITKTKAVFESMIGRVPEVKSLAAGADALHSPRSYDMIPSWRRACPWTTNSDRTAWRKDGKTRATPEFFCPLRVAAAFCADNNSKTAK